MRNAFTAAAIGLALAVSGNISMAQTSDTAISASPELRLTPQQRTEIYESVVRQKTSKVQAPANLNAAVGSEIPASMNLGDLPDNIAIEMPATKLYKYTIVGSEVLLVDPTRMKVVDVIGR
jgi:Protein of unknown function (DUF1236)